MGRSGRDFGIAPGGLEPLLSDRRIIVEVDQIVRDAWVLRLAFCDHFEDGRAFELVGIGLVGRRRRGVEGKGIIDLRFVIIWITLRELFHGLGVSLHARAVIDLVVIGVHGAERIDVVALPLGLGADGFCLRQRGGTLGEVLCRGRNMGIPKQAERDTPIGDAALGIGLQHILEYVLRRAVPE